MKEDLLELEGVITEKCPGAKFKVSVNLENNQTSELYCYLSGKLRKNKITILIGDKVTVGVSPYDLTRGVITWRHK